MPVTRRRTGTDVSDVYYGCFCIYSFIVPTILSHSAYHRRWNVPPMQRIAVASPSGLGDCRYVGQGTRLGNIFSAGMSSPLGKTG